MNDLTSEEKMSKLLKALGNVSQCKNCQELIYWVTARTGKAMPLNKDGTPHWDSCSSVRDFRIKKQKDAQRKVYGGRYE